MIEPLVWTQPPATGWATIESQVGKDKWRITPVPRDVTRISYAGVDPDGTIVTGLDHQSHAESVDEARIVVDILRAGTDDLPGWREQLEAAGFVPSYPDEDGVLSQLWHDKRRTGLFQITVREGGGANDEISVSATYESDGAQFWHNVSYINGSPSKIRTHGGLSMRQGLPHGIDALKAGVAAAIAIRAARVSRGGGFSVPLGGPTKQR